MGDKEPIKRNLSRVVKGKKCKLCAFQKNCSLGLFSLSLELMFPLFNSYNIGHRCLSGFTY